MSGDRPQEHEPAPDQTSQLAQAEAQNLAGQPGVGSGTTMSLDWPSAPGATAGSQGTNAATNGDLLASPLQAAAGWGQTTQPADLAPPKADSGNRSADTSQADNARTPNSDDTRWVGSGTAMPLDFPQARPTPPDQSSASAQEQPTNTDSTINAGGQHTEQPTFYPTDNLPPLAPEPPAFEPTRQIWTENQIERAAREPGRNEGNGRNEPDRTPNLTGVGQGSVKRQSDHPPTPEGKMTGANEAKIDRSPRGADAADHGPQNPSSKRGATDDRPTSMSSGNREKNVPGPAEIRDRSSRSPESQRIEALRDYLRQPENRVTPADAQSRHQAAIGKIWDQALALTHGQPLAALTAVVEAVRSNQQPGETHAEMVRRLDGVPSHALGTSSPNAGEDKPQHFFAAARECLAASIGTMDYDPVSRTWSPPMTGIGEAYSKLAGRLVEVGDAIKGAITKKPTGGYDRGDLHADDLGVAFGAALAGQFVTPDQLRPGATLPRITDYLK